MIVKKAVVFKSPDLSKMIEVVIDHRTKIYIPAGSDIEEARNRYMIRNAEKRNKQ